jgi:ribosomal protein L37AE/L43A
VTGARYFPDHEIELDEDLPCPSCGAPLVRRSTPVGAMWVCGCGKSFFPEELLREWPVSDGVFL